MGRKVINHIGEEKIMDCGMSAKIIRYNNATDMDILFDNGYISKGKQYVQFKKGNILNYEKRNVPKVGDVFINKEGCEYRIIEVISSSKIKIEFQDDYKYQKYVANKEIKNGYIKNPFLKNIFGVGYYGGEIKRDELTTKCYNHWYGILERCYSLKDSHKHRTYFSKCEVCEDWLCYYNFYDWFKKSYYEIDGSNDKMCIDKDIIIKGNKIYSPETCVFVPNRINVLFTKTDKNRGANPIGVTYNKRLKKYIAQCSIIMGNGHKQQQHLGVFLNNVDAFYAYKKFKEKYIKQIADEYKNIIPKKLYDAMHKWEVEIND